MKQICILTIFLSGCTISKVSPPVVDRASTASSEVVEAHLSNQKAKKATNEIEKALDTVYNYAVEIEKLSQP